MTDHILARELVLPCGVKLKNRIAKSAMSENMANPDHEANSKFVTLYRKWAQGGAGLLITGNVMIDRNALGEPANVVLDHKSQRKYLEKWARSGLENNTHIWMQLNHPGKQSPKFLSKHPVAPSALPLKAPLNKIFNTPRELSEFEIEEIINRFGQAAEMAKQSGFTGVQIHGAHGYLVSQFLSPLHNQRKDRWGGSLDNRMRFVISVFENIRSKVGGSFPVSIKLNSADFQKGGLTKEESMKVVQILFEKGMDLIEISGGSYEAPEMMGITKKSTTKAREAYFLEYCEEVRKKTKGPLMLTGGFRSLEGMENALTSDACDLIGLARSMAIDPHFPNDLLNRKEVKSQVRPLTTGFQSIDRLVPLEITWYTQQIHRMGKGLPPKSDLNVTLSILNSIIGMGVQGIKRVRQ